MLASWIGPHITGQYDLTFVPVALPTALVRALLPAEWGQRDDAFLTAEELAGYGVDLPVLEGKQWVCIEAGKQLNSGVSVPLGRRSFLEAKLEVPFLRHPEKRNNLPFTFKQTMLFSSRLIQFSAAHLTGLRSHHVVCIMTEDSFEAMDFMKVTVNGEAAVPEGQRWTDDLARKVMTGWWVGENTGHAATKFVMSTVAPPHPRPQLTVRLNLPALTQLSADKVKELCFGTPNLEENGWIELDAAGFAMSEQTKMEVVSLASL
ncbi:hypothetical protein Rt10032_c01g0176 [Rhodotorula toruloides]|uniref:Uncharacterized protein n=1 Tax=Rhodotorula toruloides TaxID=5286 RepID=A0A511K740_RHOTO|nr:hypothetical protein Rt10032_c01g0176 [Rhodotorula toruloides]